MDRLTEQEQTLEVLQDERKKQQETVRDLEEQLEHEEQARQKLLLDKTNADNKNKALEAKIVELQVRFYASCLGKSIEFNNILIFFF